jgi:uncharacterized protein YjbJ (UPF0337 family)
MEGLMEREEIKGKAERAKGWVKDKAGEITNNPDLEAEGEVDQAEGQLREGYGAAKRKVKETVDEVTDESESA